MPDLYTFIMDYRGGTYISQIEADDKDKAIILWIRELETKQIQGFSNSSKNKIIESGFPGHDEATSISGMQNVWCFDVKAKNGLAIINVVKTDKH